MRVGNPPDHWARSLGGLAGNFEGGKTMGSLGRINGNCEGGKPVGSLGGITRRDHWAGALAGITVNFEGGYAFGASFMYPFCGSLFEEKLVLSGNPKRRDSAT